MTDDLPNSDSLFQSPQCGRRGSNSGNNSAPGGSQDIEQPQGLDHAEDAAEHEHMKAVLRTSLSGCDKESSGLQGLRTRTRSRPGRGGEGEWGFLKGDLVDSKMISFVTQKLLFLVPVGRTMQARTPAVEDTQTCGDDAADEIMERIVKSATQGPGTRTQPRERRRSRANRKSCTSSRRQIHFASYYVLIFKLALSVRCV